MGPVSQLSGRIGALKRHHGPDHPDVTGLRAELAAAQIADYVRRVVDHAPPLTEAQRHRIASLLAPAPKAGRAAG